MYSLIDCIVIIVPIVLTIAFPFPLFFSPSASLTCLSPLLPSIIFPTCSLSSSEDAPFRGGCSLSMAKGGAYLSRTRNQAGYMKGVFSNPYSLTPLSIYLISFLSLLFPPIFLPFVQESSHLSVGPPAYLVPLACFYFICSVLYSLSHPLYGSLGSPTFLGDPAP